MYGSAVLSLCHEGSLGWIISSLRFNQRVELALKNEGRLERLDIYLLKIN